MAGFLAMAFAVVGMTGLLAAFIAPLPLERALQREAVLDEVLVAVRASDAAALEALRPRLGDSAAAVLPAGGTSVAADFEARVAAERVAMRARRLGEAESTQARLGMMLGVVTLVAAAFGAVMMLVGRPSAVPDGAKRLNGQVFLFEEEAKLSPLKAGQRPPPAL